MKILKFDNRNGEMKVVPETMEDLWHLSRILEQNDIIASKSSRVYKKTSRVGIRRRERGEEACLHRNSG